MKLIHDSGYSQEELESFKEVIFSNTIQSMRVILEAMEVLGIQLKDSGNRTHVEVILQSPHQLEVDRLPAEIATAVKALWSDAGVLECYSRKSEYQLNDSAN
jgi:guanine nucleotide-binding protein subunit alpha